MAATSKIPSFVQRNLKFAETYKAPVSLAYGILKSRDMGGRVTVNISCSDPRVIPEQFLNLEFEAGIIRNAGGRARDALRSLLALDMVGNLGTVMVIHHTDCGMSHTDEESFHAHASAKNPEVLETLKGSAIGTFSDPEKSVVEDVKFLKSFPSFAKNVEIVGFVFDTETGLLKQSDI